MEFVVVILLILNIWFILIVALATLVNRTFKAKNYERAILYSTILTFLNPINGKIFYGRGLTYQANGQLDLAIKDFVRAIKLRKGSFQSYYALLDILCVKHRVEKFAPFANEIVRFLPNQAESYNIRGVYYMLLEQYDDALADFEKSLMILPTEPRYISNQAWSLYKLGKVAVAKKIYDDLVKTNINFLHARQNLIIIAIEEKRLEDALTLADALLKIDNASSFYFQLRSRIYRKLERYTEAFTDIEFALRLQSDQAGHYLERGLIYTDMQNYDSAIADFTQSIALAPLESCPYVDRGAVYFVLDRIDEAHADAVKAYELEADSKYSISLLALTSFIRGEIDEAQRLWRDMVELDERYMDVAWTVEDLGWKDLLVAVTEKLIATL
ncbi:MAG: tetratricopeptide repeat protein [Aggregatilineales bacterium]